MFKSKGIDAIVLTNHYAPADCDKLSSDLKEQAQIYTDTFFRAKAKGDAPANMRYVHGVEVYNPHLRFDARYEDSLKLAEQNGKIKTAGSDFHIECQAGLAGMIIPDYVNNQFELRDYLKSEKQTLFDKNGVIYESK